MARQREDLTGRKFNSLTVVSYNKEVSVQKKGAHWNCKCDCGNEKVVWGSDLKRGKTKSCGCCNKEKSGEVVKKVKKQREDLTGLRFGRLVVISYNEEVTKQKKRTYWNCKCDCGNEKVIRGSHLRSGDIVSCGCYNRDRVKEQWKDEEYRQMMSDKMREMVEEMWQDEEFKQKQIDKTKEMWQDEEFKQMMSDKMARENNPSWKGGITPTSIHLGHLPVVKQWFSSSKQQVNYTCELTGKVGGVNTHHLKAFSIIVKEAHELNNIQVKQQVKDYTEEELHKLEEYVASWHKDTSNAVVLSEEVHMLFHSLYGKGDNTPEQFEEFRERYIAGEFKDLI